MEPNSHSTSVADPYKSVLVLLSGIIHDVASRAEALIKRLLPFMLLTRLTRSRHGREGRSIAPATIVSSEEHFYCTGQPLEQFESAFPEWMWHDGEKASRLPWFPSAWWLMWEGGAGFKYGETNLWLEGQQFNSPERLGKSRHEKWMSNAHLSLSKNWDALEQSA